MRYRHYTITRSEVHHHTQRRLQQHLRLPNYSRKCTQPVLLAVVLAAAAGLTSLFAACKRLTQAPSGETIRKALLATLPEQAELQRRLRSSPTPWRRPAGPTWRSISSTTRSIPRAVGW